MTAPTIRPTLPPLPPRLARLPIDARGYPVPWFVAVVDGVPDHRVVDSAKVREAVRFHRCMMCGDNLGAYLTFVAGPMCGLNRVSGEPPHHRECAEYAVRACPFLTRPKAQRREAGLEGMAPPGGILLPRNPGVSMLYTTKRYEVERAGPGVIFRMGPPVSVTWTAEGRPATRAEVLASIASGYPALHALAVKDGPEAVRALDAARAAFERDWLPA